MTVMPFNLTVTASSVRRPPWANGAIGRVGCAEARRPKHPGAVLFSASSTAHGSPFVRSAK